MDMERQKDMIVVLRELALIDERIEKIEQSILFESEGLISVMEEVGKNLSLKEILNKLIEKKTELNERYEEKIREIENRKKAIEEKKEEIEDRKDYIARGNELLNQTKHNDEFLKIVSALNEAAKIIANNEITVSTLQNEINRFTKDAEKLKEKMEEEIPEIDKRIEIIENGIDEMDKKKEECIKRKEKLLSELPPEIASRYNRIKNLRGSAVAIIDGQICTGCSSILPPQRVAEVKKGQILLTCEQCGRFLVWNIEEEQ